MRHCILTLLLYLVCIGASAKPFEHNGIYYNIIDNSSVEVYNASGYGVVAKWYEYYKGTVNIPATISVEGKSYNVTRIADKAFMGQTGLTMVVIPKTVESIGKQGFSGCTNLKSVAFSSGGVLSSIGKEAFLSCAITSLNFPKSLKIVGEYAFKYCEALKSIKGGDSIELLDKGSFQGCINLTEITLPESVKTIGDFAFWNCTALRTVVMNEGLETIGNDAFLECSSLATVKISNTVKTIGWEAFRWCLNLRSIVIPNSVEKMDYGTFRYCTGLESITLSNALQKIPAWAFEQTALKSIEIPNSVTTIEVSAFTDCSKLSEVKWGSSLEYIYASAFIGTNLSKVELPEPLKEIGMSAFAKCENLVEVTIPYTTIRISDFAFTECPKLKTVYNYAITPQEIPYTQSPFVYCDNPVEVHIFEGLKDEYETSIGWSVAVEKNYIVLKDDIKASKISSITIDGAPIYCTVGETGVATATITPSNAFNRALSWSSSDESILYIDELSGQYVALEPGTATITAKATDGSGVSATALETVTDDTGIKENFIDATQDVIFNLRGEKLSVPTKGINIINGKKVLIY